MNIGKVSVSGTDRKCAVLSVELNGHLCIRIGRNRTVDRIILAFRSCRKLRVGRNNKFRFSGDHVDIDISGKSIGIDPKLSFSVDLDAGIGNAL